MYFFNSGVAAEFVFFWIWLETSPDPAHWLLSVILSPPVPVLLSRKQRMWHPGKLGEERHLARDKRGKEETTKNVIADESEGNLSGCSDYCFDYEVWEESLRI